MALMLRFTNRSSLCVTRLCAGLWVHIVTYGDFHLHFPPVSFSVSPPRSFLINSTVLHLSHTKVRGKTHEKSYKVRVYKWVHTEFSDFIKHQFKTWRAIFLRFENIISGDILHFQIRYVYVKERKEWDWTNQKISFLFLLTARHQTNAAVMKMGLVTDYLLHKRGGQQWGYNSNRASNCVRFSSNDEIQYLLFSLLLCHSCCSLCNGGNYFIMILTEMVRPSDPALASLRTAAKWAAVTMTGWERVINCTGDQSQSMFRQCCCWHSLKHHKPSWYPDFSWTGTNTSIQQWSKQICFLQTDAIVFQSGCGFVS